MKGILVRLLRMIMWLFLFFLFLFYGISVMANLFYWIITGRHDITNKATVLVDYYIDYMQNGRV